uniref:Ras-associating domain-containing protein n=1 Tax=Lutzomyia longipalpis TaxID=7200 RepID=A0A1B0CFZ8_LUTLO
MTANEKRLLDREALRSVIQQWNANRLDLFELSEPDENLQFHGVMRFYFQDAGQKVATKCIRVASDATVQDVIETLIEKFRPDMRMLSLPNYALYEVHSNHEERKLNGDEKPLLVQLNWHIDDREGRFLLRNTEQKSNPLESGDTNFKRKLSKREKKEQKKKEKLQKMQSTNTANVENHVAEKLYTELPETSFTRSISNPEAVMRRRRQQKLEKKLQQFRSRDGGPDTGGTLKIYGESLCRDVPYKTLLLSIRDCAQAVVREMLAKYGLDKTDPLHYCLVQVNSDGTEYILDDDECPLSILMNHPTSRELFVYNLQFHGVMRFYFQDAGQKVATKCIRVASDATVQDVIETLIEKFRPDMRMLSLPNYALYEVHSNHEERKLNGDEKPLLVQLNWHIDDREGSVVI